MKQFVWAVCAVVMAGCGQGSGADALTVSGTVKNAGTQRIYLEENVPNGAPLVMDSAQLKADGSFELKAPVKEESLYHLRLQGRPYPLGFFINDTKRLTVTADPTNRQQPYSVTGSPASEALVQFDKTLFAKGSALYALSQRVDSLSNAKADSAMAVDYPKLEAATADIKSYAQQFLRGSKSPVLTLYGLGAFQNTANNLGMTGFSGEEIRALLGEAGQRFPNHTALQAVLKNLPADAPKAGTVAPRAAPDFTQPDANGKPVSLSSFKGKYVLVDFWASWCKPCRLENPNVVKAYQTFKDKNFTVFGVSLDREKDAWQQAIQQDGLTWTHASDLQFWNNAAAALYGVQSIPANFLVDPRGNIIAQDLRGEDLQRTLAGLLR